MFFIILFHLFILFSSASVFSPVYQISHSEFALYTQKTVDSYSPCNLMYYNFNAAVYF